jgi:thiol-disulfide isomerase/thioredoxin
MTMRGTILLLTLALIAGALAGQPQRKKKPAATAPAAAPAVKANYGKYDFLARTLEGKEVRLADHAGKVVLVNIWAPWCGPCKTEAPGFVRLYEQYHARGFDVIGVAVQTNEADVRSFIQKYSLPWPTVIADSIARVYGTYGLPDNFLFNREGALVKRFVGLTREEALAPLIEEALKEPRTGR